MPPPGLYFIALVAAACLVRANLASDEPNSDADADSVDYQISEEADDHEQIYLGTQLIGQITCPKQMRTPREGWKVASIRLYQGKSDSTLDFSNRFRSIKEVKCFGGCPETGGGKFREKDIDLLPMKWGFDLKKPTIICIAGFEQRLSHPYLQRLRSGYDTLKAARGGISPINLIFFDWIKYPNGWLQLLRRYGDTVADIDYLGRLLAHFIKQLSMRHNYKPDKVHILTHSMSVHIGGAAGRQLVADGLGQVSQISAIDPTGVCFHNLSMDLDDEFGLKATDAKLVLANHYDMHSLGSKHPIGNVDIFVNGGKDQPDVDQKFIEKYPLVEKIMNARGVADHIRSVWHDLWQTIPTDCHDVAYECESFEKFRQGHCASCGDEGESCAMIGTIATTALGLEQSRVNYKPNTRLFITTGRNSLCLHHYQVVAELKMNTSEEVLRNFIDGSVAYEIDHDLTIRPRYASSDSPDSAHKFTELLRLNTNDLRFRPKLSEQSFEVFEAIESISINYMSNMSKDKREEKSVRYCPATSAEDSQTMTICENN